MAVCNFVAPAPQPKPARRLKFSFLVVEAEDWRHRVCSAELHLSGLEVFICGCHVLAQHSFHFLSVSIGMHDCKVVSVCTLPGDGVWQVRDIHVEEKGCQDAPLSAQFAVAHDKGEAAIANHLHDHAN